MGLLVSSKINRISLRIVSVILFFLVASIVFISLRADETTPPYFNFYESYEGVIYGTTAYYDFNVTDDEENIANIQVEIDSEGRLPVSLYDAPIDSQSEDAYFELDLADYNDGFEHTITFYAKDELDNESFQSFNFTVVLDEDLPVINVTQSASGTINFPDTTELTYEFTATDATSSFSQVAYCLYNENDGGCSYIDIVPEDGNLDSDSESFSITFQAEDFNDGIERYIFFIAADQAYNEASSDEYAFKVIEVNSDDVTPPTLNFIQASEGTITDSYFLDYEFSSTDTENILETFEYQIDGGSRVGIEAEDGAFDDFTENGLLRLDAIDFDDDLEHTITFYSTDLNGNEASQAYNFTIDVNFENPFIDFSTSHSGLTPNRFHFIGTAYDMTGIKLIQLKWDANEFTDTPFDFGDLSTTTEQEFDFSFVADEINLPEGANDLDIFITDIDDNVVHYNYSLDIDKGIPTCTATWNNLPTPHFSNEVTYPEFNCTDNRGIVSAKYDVYHAVWGYLNQNVAVNSIDGVFGGTSEDFTFSFTLDINQDRDGRLITTFKARDAAGNESNDYDEIVIEYKDSFAPILNIDAITPDPTTDTTPKLTGNCGDITNLDTNSNIANLEYMVDATGWLPLPVTSGSLNDSHTETFSYELPVLAVGVHTVEVKCTDASNRTTTKSDTFTVELINESEAPGEFSYEDSFDTHLFQDISNTNLIWGNGQLRLKENISVSRELISNDNYLPRYSPSRNRFRIVQDLVNPNLIWFSTDQRVSSYNTQTNAITTLDTNALFGVAQFGGIKDVQVSMYEGDQILWISEDGAMYVLNLNTMEGVRRPINYFANIGQFVPDTDRGRLGTYFQQEGSTVPSGRNEVSYWDLNGTISNTVDDTVFNHDNDIYGISITNVVKIAKKPNSNYIYLSPYSSNRVVKVDDNNTPTDQSDDTMAYYSSGSYNTVFAFTFDPDGNVIWGTDNNSFGQVFVVESENGTPMFTGDDVVTKLSNPIDIGYKGITELKYIEAQNNIGDQILIGSQANNPVYLNFNSTYSDTLDDTFIEFNVNNGVRPNSIANLFYDYNTIYSNIDQQGLYRINLNRGWVNNGQAIGVPQRPSNKLILNNFVADATDLTPIAIGENNNSLLNDINNLIFPKVQAAPTDGITYSISNDDGVTWNPVTLGEIKQLSPANYNVRFRIEMVTLGGATPVLNSYSLNFAGYTTPEQSEEVSTLVVTNTPASTTANTNFSLVVQTIDELGFPVVGNSDNITLTLIDTSTNSAVSGLNKSSVTLTDGSISLTDVTINKNGTFIIRATNGILTADSATITVTGADSQSPVPTLVFYADKYSIKKGESITLGWNSSYLNSLSISPGVGNVTSVGSYIVTPTQTTTYVISGEGNYGSLSAGFTVVVDNIQQDSTTPVSAPVSFVPVASQGTNKITINTIGDLTVNKGDKVNFSWSVANANNIYIDYLGKNVASQGNFEFVADQSIVITITAKNGDQTEVKSVRITVLDLPVDVNTDIATIVVNTATSLPPAIIAALAILNTVFIGGLIVNAVGTGALTLTSLQNLFMIAGIIPYKKRKGYVYQTQTIKGIPFATINLVESDSRNILATITTDLDGTYYYPSIAEGNYYLEVKHSDNLFPTRQQRSVQQSILDFYKGEVIAVNSNKEQQQIVIPMDQLNALDGKVAFKTKVLMFVNQTLIWLQWTLYPMLILAIIAAVLVPSLLNILIALVYVILVSVKLLGNLKLPTLKIKIIDKVSGSGINNAFVELRDSNRALVAIGKTNSSGVAKFYIPKAVYSVTINAKEYISDSGFGELKTVDSTQDKNYEFFVVKTPNL